MKMKTLLLLNQMKKSGIGILGVLAVGILGSLATFYWQTQATSSQKDLTSETVLVQSQDWVVKIEANGVVQAVQKINLSPEDSGRIAKLYINEGDRVQKGQIVARMNTERLQAQVNQYQASLNKTLADLKQKISGTRQEEIAESQARVAAAEASLTAAQTRLHRAIAEMKRNQPLVEDGAISRNVFEEFVTREQEARANVEAELARLKEQRQSFNKAKNGFRPEEIAQAEAEVAEAKAQLAFYQSQLDNAVIRAPFVGIITRRFAQEGDFVTPNTSASATEGASSTSIAELSSGLEIEARIPEASIAKINRGQSVDIYTDTYPNETFKGRVSLIAPRAVQENNITFFRVKVALSSGQNKLKSGMNVRLTLHSQAIKDALVIPLAAVATRPDGQIGVYLPDSQNAARFQPVRVNPVSGEKVQVLAGLKKGDRVLMSPPSTEKIQGIDKVEF